jgi:hypothetical protein
MSCICVSISSLRHPRGPSPKTRSVRSVGEPIDALPPPRAVGAASKGCAAPRQRAAARSSQGPKPVVPPAGGRHSANFTCRRNRVAASSRSRPRGRACRCPVSPRPSPSRHDRLRACSCRAHVLLLGRAGARALARGVVAPALSTSSSACQDGPSEPDCPAIASWQAVVRLKPVPRAGHPFIARDVGDRGGPARSQAQETDPLRPERTRPGNETGNARSCSDGAPTWFGAGCFALLNHLVGPGKQQGGKGDTECRSGLGIDQAAQTWLVG